MTAATAKTKRSPLELEPALLAQVEDVSDYSAANPNPEDEEAVAFAAERDRLIEAYIKERGVPRNVAIIMVDKGYSKGTAHRIIADQNRNRLRAMEVAASKKQNAAAQ